MGRPKKVVMVGGEGCAPADFETHTRIIEAAKELFKARGFKGVSMKDLAEAVSLTPAALYYYFPEGKETLFLAVLTNLLDERAQGIARAISSGTDLRSKLYQITLFSLTGISDAFPILMRDILAQIKDEQKQKETWTRFGGDYMAAVIRVFDEAATAGEIAPGLSPALLATLFIGMNFSLGHNHHNQAIFNNRAEAESLAETVVSILFNGIREVQAAPAQF
jgi:AcrR family transcriptional regulator